MRGRKLKPTRRRLAVVAALFALAVLVQAAVVFAGGATRTGPQSVSGSAPVAIPGAHGRVFVGHSYKNDVSPALGAIPAMPLKPMPEREAAPNPRIGSHRNAADPVVQRTQAPASMPAPSLNFNGIPFPGVACNCAPPDTNGEVGATQYVQIVNEGFQVFSKSTGASLYGPAGITTIWSGFGGVCQNKGHGDPVVIYDQIANRWVISQFAGVSVPTDECIAVSTTSDATGSYNRYGFHLGSNFFDYPKIGMWPAASNNGYYMSDNVFNSAGTAFLGTQAFAFDRAAMLAGAVAAFVTPGLTPGGSANEAFLPADLDGSTLPSGPCPFVEFPDGGNGNTYRTWLFHPDFVTPANSTFVQRASPAAAPYTALCSG